MNIGKASKRSGVTAKTIRYYESIGLIPEAARAENGYRDYGETEVQTLRFIKRARSLGFAIEDVRNLLDLWQNKDRASADVKAVALNHIEDVQARIRELESIRDTLKHLTACCHGDDRPDCPILEGLASNEVFSEPATKAARKADGKAAGKAEAKAAGTAERDKCCA